MNLIQGKGPRILLLEAPPRHGKSEYVSKYLPAWFLGRFPSARVILASYEAQFARSWGRKARDVFSESAQSTFGVELSSSQSAGSDWENQEGGGMVTAGVGGPITGRGANLLIVDDPVKNAEEAASPIVREAHWEWWESTAKPRLEPGAVAILMMTRWNEDDLIGRMIRRAQLGEGPVVNRLQLPAIAEDNDPIGRAPGEALWPERWPLKIHDETGELVGGLEHTRHFSTPYWWSAQYQQNPTPREGLFFKVDKLKIIDAAPADLKKVFRAWDSASSAAKGDYTVGVKMGRDADGIFYVLDIVRGQWDTDARNRTILQTAKTDGTAVKIRLPEDPGSAGVDVGKMWVRMLAGFSAKAVKVTGPKEDRADPFSAQVNAGNVRLISGAWNKDFIEELRTFPAGTNDDQVDAAADCFNELTGKKKLAVGTG